LCRSSAIGKTVDEIIEQYSVSFLAEDKFRMTLDKFIKTINDWGSRKIPFLFIIDFELKKPLVFPLSEINPEKIAYDFNGVTNVRRDYIHAHAVELEKFPAGINTFRDKFENVIRHLEYGDSYLANLTIRTELKIKGTLKDLFFASTAKYKLLFENDFLVFSPEIFIQIREGKIFSYPMKGTIDASIPSAAEKILNDQKELAEHVTIVDLIRNDLSMVASHVELSRFRYIEELKTNDKKLLQVSSEIVGELDADFKERLGEILVKLLPAGSVSGAPKDKTVEIIRQAEGEERGYYTGIFGIYDGYALDSGVMIRFIERQQEKYFYRSGGGITTQSVLEKEYQEAIDKVYVPVI
jgi:para-aminobenzoate synthetase component I